MGIIDTLFGRPIKKRSKSDAATRDEYLELWDRLHLTQQSGLFNFKTAVGRLEFEDEDFKNRLLKVIDELLDVPHDAPFPARFQPANWITRGEYDELFAYLYDIGVWTYSMPLKATAKEEDSLYWCLRARAGTRDDGADAVLPQITGLFRTFSTTGVPQLMARGALFLHRDPHTRAVIAIATEPRLEDGSRAVFAGSAVLADGRLALVLFDDRESLSATSLAHATRLTPQADTERAVRFLSLAAEGMAGLAGSVLAGERTGRVLARRIPHGDVLSASAGREALAQLDHGFVRLDKDDLTPAELQAAFALGLLVSKSSSFLAATDAAWAERPEVDPFSLDVGADSLFRSRSVTEFEEIP